MDETNNIVSILVPVYGVEKYIERCARSLFEQTFENIEYIFVDDCSPDRSIEILKQVIDDYPQRKPHVRIIRHEHNRGLAAARNTAVENCRTEFLMHVDSDDYIDECVISECLKLVNNDDVDIVTIGLERIKGNNTSIDKVHWNSDTKEMTRKVITHQVHNAICGRLIKTSLYKDNNIKVEVGRGMSEDLQVTPRLFYFAKKTIYTDKVYYHYVNNDSSYTSSFSIDKFHQSMLAFNLLEIFFQDKEAFLRRAVVERKMKSYKQAIINTAKYDGDQDAYEEIKKIVATEPRDNYSYLSIPERAILCINSFMLLKIVVFCGTKIRYLLNKCS